MLLESNGPNLIDAQVLFTESLHEFLYKRFRRIEDWPGGEEPDPVHQRIHRDDFIELIQALSKSLDVAQCSLAYELRVELFALREFSIGQLSLRQASLENEVAKNWSRSAHKGPAEHRQNTGEGVIHKEFMPTFA